MGTLSFVSVQCHAGGDLYFRRRSRGFWSTRQQSLFDFRHCDYERRGRHEYLGEMCERDYEGILCSVGIAAGTHGKVTFTTARTDLCTPSLLLETRTTMRHHRTLCAGLLSVSVARDGSVRVTLQRTPW